MHATATMLSLDDTRALEHRSEHCRVLIDSRNCTLMTRFECGGEVVACPNLHVESVARARPLGYRESDEATVWARTRDNDVVHTVMADAQGHPWPATLHAVAHEYRLVPGVVVQRERLVPFARRLQNVGLEHILRRGNNDSGAESAPSCPGSTGKS